MTAIVKQYLVTQWRISPHNNIPVEPVIIIYYIYLLFPVTWCLIGILLLQQCGAVLITNMLYSPQLFQISLHCHRMSMIDGKFPMCVKLAYLPGWCCVVVWSGVCCDVVWSGVVLCCVMLCYVVLCCVVLRYGVCCDVAWCVLCYGKVCTVMWSGVCCDVVWCVLWCVV